MVKILVRLVILFFVVPYALRPGSITANSVKEAYFVWRSLKNTQQVGAP